MRRIHVILLGIFMTGVLLGGIGTGIAFGEYSTMEYGGTVMLGEEYLVTGELIYEFEPVPGEKIAVNPINWGRTYGKSALEMDESLPMGTICYDVTYNSKLTIPNLYYWEEENPESVYAGETSEEGAYGENEGDAESSQISINEETVPVEEAAPEKENVPDEESVPEKTSVIVGYLEIHTNYIGSEFELLMKDKDNILQNLKQKKINSYETAYITDVKVRVNPDMMEYIEDRTMY